MVRKVHAHARSGATPAPAAAPADADAPTLASQRPAGGARGRLKRKLGSVRKVLATTLQAERMSKVDTAWLRMDSDSNLMMIVGVWVLQPAIALDALRARIAERLLQYPRFRQCVVEDAVGATWVDDPHFDLRHHLVVERLPRHRRGQEQQALQERLAQLTMQPLDRRHPLWQIHVVEHYRGGSALLFRIHHCIADGIALIAVTQSLVDGGTAPPPLTLRPPLPVVDQNVRAAAETWISDTLIRPLAGWVVRALDATGDGAARSLGLLADPRQGLEQGLQDSTELARLALHALGDVAALALMPDDSPTSLKGQPGPAKGLAWCPPLPLDEVKAVGKALQCSVNDVLLACVAGALGDYLRSRGEPTEGVELRALVPVNLRALEEAHRLGNQFGLVPLVLPVGLENPVERVYEVRRRMAALKGSIQPLLAYGLLAVSGLLLKPVQDALLGLFSRKATAVMTNVPGPRQRLTVCGATIEETLFWVPQSGSVGLGVSILSYAGGVQFGVVADRGLCPDPQALIDRFAPEFERLLTLTLMLPWGETG